MFILLCLNLIFKLFLPVQNVLERTVGQLGSPKKVKKEEVMLELRLEVGVRVFPQKSGGCFRLKEHGVQKPRRHERREGTPNYSFIVLTEKNGNEWEMRVDKISREHVGNL